MIRVRAELSVLIASDDTEDAMERVRAQMSKFAVSVGDRPQVLMIEATEVPSEQIRAGLTSDAKALDVAFDAFMAAHPRYIDTALDSEVFVAFVRDKLFGCMDGFPRWKSIAPSAVVHSPHCRGVPRASSVASSTRALAMTEWEQILTVRRFVTEKIQRHPWVSATVDVFVWRHEMACASCGRYVASHTARVVIPWAGRTLCREYLLRERLASGTSTAVEGTDSP